MTESGVRPVAALLKGIFLSPIKGRLHEPHDGCEQKVIKGTEVFMSIAQRIKTTIRLRALVRSRPQKCGLALDDTNEQEAKVGRGLATISSGVPKC